MNFNDQELSLIKEGLNNFIKSVEYSDNQDYIDENKKFYLEAKKILLSTNFLNEDLKLIKSCLRDYIFDLDEDRYEIETKLSYIQKKINDIKILENKILF